MKFSRLFFSVLLLLFVNSVFAQQKKLDPYLIVSRELYPKTLRILEWIPNTTNVIYSEDMNKLMLKSIPDNKTEILLNIDEINEKVKAINKDLKANSFGTINWIDGENLRLIVDNYLLNYNIKSKSLTYVNHWDKEAENLDVEYKTGNAIYTKGKNVIIAIKGVEKVIISETKDNVVYCSAVHRNEFGIEKGTFWSPSGNYVAFYRMDESMVTDYPLVDVTSRIAVHKPIKYPMAGMTSHQVTLGIYDLKTNKLLYVETGEPKDQYLTSITWSPDEKNIYIGLLNREQNHLKLNKYDVNTGSLISTLFEEKSSKYVEPLDPLYFIPGKNNEFLYFSQRDGYRHLYLYNTDGKLIKQVTKGPWVVKDIIGFDANNNRVYFTATKDSPIELNIYSAEIKTGNIKKISSQKGQHEGKISSNGKYIIDKYTSLTIPYQVDILNEKGQIVTNLYKSNDPLILFDMPKTEIFTIKADDGTDLYCRLIKPTNFDANKKYPAIVYVYGGPHAQLITDSWLGGAGLFLNFLAQEGYVVFTLDNRGSANRGFEFESVIHRNLGSVELADQMVGVKWLKKQAYVDTNRIGIHGWSYGGYMAINLMLTYPDVFKVGVAGGPVVDWKYYEVMYGERYMGTPENNEAGYNNSSLLPKVKNLKGRLLVIHGAIDPIVVWQHSLLLLEQSIKDKKHIDYFVYPTHEHNVIGKDRGHLFEKIYLYFKDYL